jgi:uncharacterized protein
MYNVVLSLDGRKEINDKVRTKKDGSGTYDNIVMKFKKLVDDRKKNSRYKNYYVRGTFTNFNKDFANDFEHLASLGFDQISIEPVVADASKNYALKQCDLNILFKEYDKLAKIILNNNNRSKFFHFEIDLKNSPCLAKRASGCGSGSEYLAITPNGDIYPCHQFVGINKFRMGNVLKNKSSKEINASLKKYFINCNIFNKNKCNKCWAKFYCSGGCHANAFNFSKDIYKPCNFLCELQKKRIECAIGVQTKIKIMNKK